MRGREGEKEGQRQREKFTKIDLTFFIAFLTKYKSHFPPPPTIRHFKA